jgi:carboxyl-terminal processing protease
MLWLVWVCTAVWAAVEPRPSAPPPATGGSARAAGVGAVNSKALVGANISVEDLILLERSARSLPPLEATSDESAIARLTSKLLPRQHYLQQPFDHQVSSRFLDEYLESLDNLHLHFLQSDVEEFDRYRERLDELTKRGDTSPGREIYARFLQRVEQRVAYVADLLKSDKFDFAQDDRYLPDRRHAPRPKDLAEAHTLWRQQLRFEILQEKLGAKKPKPSTPDQPKGAETAAPATEPAGGESTPAEPKLLPNGLTEDLVQTLTRRYARLLRTLRDFDGGDVFQIYLTALTHVYDPHSDYLGKASLENFAIGMNLSLFGIGAVLQSEDGYCKVKELRPGPALRSKKIKPGDRIVAVAQAEGDPVDVVDMKLSKVVELVRGPKGSRVRLTLIPVDAADSSQHKQVTLVRDEIRLEDEEAKAKLIELPAVDGRTMRLGVIDLPSFYASFDLRTRNGRGKPRSTVIDVAKLLVKLKEEKVDGVILDLRHNGGGALEEAIQVTGLFIKDGPVVQVRDAGGNVDVDSDEDSEIVYDGPLIVLTSRFSASASEILAAALQDYGRALIVGDSSTHGKGTVQSLVQLGAWVGQMVPQSTNDPGALKLTIRKFYRANGSSTQLKGVTPDVVLPSVNNYAELGEASLDAPLAWDTIPSAKFDPVNRVQPFLAELRERSQRRVAADQDFAYVQEDVELYRKHQADKTVSLNEAARRQEKQQIEARLEARKEERKARPQPAETTYEISLKRVNQPGLPPPSTGKESVDGAESDEGTLKADADEEAGEEAPPPVDVNLKEAKRILVDLIELSRKEPALVSTRKPAAP